MVEPVAEPDPFEDLDGIGLAAKFPAQLERDEHVFHRGQGWDQLKVLEDESDEPVAQRRAGILVEALQRRSVQPHRTAGGIVEPGAKPEQGGLAASRWADDRAAVARFQRQMDGAQDRQLAARVAVGLAQIPNFEDGSGYRFPLEMNSGGRLDRDK